MPATLQQVQEIITKQFPGADVQKLTVDDLNGRITGFFVWSGFKKLGPKERNRLVTRMVRNELGLRGMNVGLLIPLAPNESL